MLKEDRPQKEENAGRDKPRDGWGESKRTPSGKSQCPTFLPGAIF